MLRYKLDMITELKAAGYNSVRIREENLMPQSALQKLRRKKMVGIITIDQICKLLHMQPGDFIEWIPDDDQDNKKSPQ